MLNYCPLNFNSDVFIMSEKIFNKHVGDRKIRKYFHTRWCLHVLEWVKTPINHRLWSIDDESLCRAPGQRPDKVSMASVHFLFMSPKLISTEVKNFVVNTECLQASECRLMSSKVKNRTKVWFMAARAVNH